MDNERTDYMRRFVETSLLERKVKFDFLPKEYLQDFDVFVINNKWKVIVASYEYKYLFNNKMPKGYDGIIFLFKGRRMAWIYYGMDGKIEKGLPF